MSANGLITPDDSEMADCDEEKVVTMMDVLQEQQEFEDDANAVLGASDDKNCTYTKGYIKRQAVYACMTCCTDAKTDPAKQAGVCLACSLSCHENHELIELYTKRNFRCDCGNPKFNSNPCQFNPNKTDLNEDNKYNQNYSGLYCICHRPYPDPESTDEDEMIQCIICEDWLHASHLDAVVPAIDQYAEMICKGCMENNEFLHDYSSLTITVESVDVEVGDRSMSNGNTSNSEVILSGDNEKNVNAESNGISDTKDDLDNTAKPKINDEQTSTSFKGLENFKENMIEAIEQKDTECKTSNENSNNTSTLEISSAAVNVEDKNMSTEENQKYDILEENSEKEIVILNETEFFSTKPNTAENDNCSHSGPNNTIEKSKGTISEVCEKSVCVKDEEKTTNEIKEENENTNILSPQDPNNTSEENNDIVKDGSSCVVTTPTKDNLAETTDKQVSTVPLAAEKSVESYQNTEPKIEIDSVNTELQDTGTKLLIDKEISNTSEITNGNEIQTSTENVAETDETNKEISTDNVNDKENNADNVNGEQLLTNTKETKRKLSTEDNNDVVMVKKIKYEEEKSCLRPKGVTRHLKGATFWPSNFRQKLCTCSECLSMYKDLAVLFLIDTEDTVTAYETLGKERSEGNPSSQYEKGLEALSSLDRIQQINALTEYNKMRDKLVDFLKSFKDRKEIVKEEDIKAFFAGMKPKREPDGVYFCR